MFSSDYKDEMRGFIKQVLAGSMKYLKYYWMNSNYCMSASEYREKVYHETIEKNVAFPFKVRCGASKLAIMFEEFEDVVFKIPFIGSATLETMEGSYAPGNIEAFTYADSDVGWNYCLADKHVYERIANEADEIEDFFCEVEFLDWVDDHPIYVQERVSKIIDDVDFDSYSQEHQVSKDSLDFCKEGWFQDSLKDLSWGNTRISVLFAKIYDDYGEDVAEELLRYMTEEIDDLHELNYGINEDGYIRIFDYSGFDN